GDVELLVVDVVTPADPGGRVPGLHFRVIGRQVLAANDQRVDPEFGRQVVHGELGQDAVLRVTRGPHGLGAAGVDERDRVRPLPVLDGVEVDVGQQVQIDRGPAGVPRRAVTIDGEGGDGAVLLPPDLDLPVRAGAVAGGRDFL